MKHPADINSIWQSFLTATGIVTTSEPSSKSTINNIINKSGDYLDEAINDFKKFLNIEYACKTEDEKTKEFLKKCRRDKKKGEVLDIFISTLASKKPKLLNTKDDKEIITTSEYFKSLLIKEMDKSDEKMRQAEEKRNHEIERQKFFKEVGLDKELDSKTVLKNKKYVQVIIKLIDDAEIGRSLDSNHAVEVFKNFLKIEDSSRSSETETQQFLRICRHDKRRSEVLDIFISAFSSRVKLIKDSNADNIIKTTGFEFRKKLAEAMFFCDEQRRVKNENESQRVSHEKKSKEIEGFEFNFKNFEEKVDEEILKTKKELARIAKDSYLTDLIKTFQDKKKREKESSESSESSETISKFLLEDYTKNKDEVDQFKKKLLKKIKDEEETDLSCTSKIDSEFDTIQKNLSSYIKDFIEHKANKEFENLEKFVKKAWKKSRAFRQDFEMPLGWSKDNRLGRLERLKTNRSRTTPEIDEKLRKAILSLKKQGVCEEDFAAQIYLDDYLFSKLKNRLKLYEYEIDTKDAATGAKAKAATGAKAKAATGAKAEAAEAAEEEAKKTNEPNAKTKSPLLEFVNPKDRHGVCQAHQSAIQNHKNAKAEAAAENSNDSNQLSWLGSLLEQPNTSPVKRERDDDLNFRRASKKRRTSEGTSDFFKQMVGFLGLGK